MNELFKLILPLLLVLFSLTGLKAQEKDSTGTPFRKGRWLTGLSGTISSSTNSFGQSDEYSNQYGITISTGNFVIPRFLVGVVFNATRDQSTNYINREAEVLFVGPSAVYYLSKDKIGSVFIGLAPGYVRYRENATITQPSITVKETIEGNGFGMKLSLGYSYVLHDRIAFDLGLIFSRYQVDITRRSEPTGNSTKDILNIGDLTFFFGFNVLLDRFSF